MPCPLLLDPGDGPLGGCCLRLGPARAPAGPPGDAGQPHECPQPVPAHLSDGHPEWHRPQLPVTPREQVSDAVSLQFNSGGGIGSTFQGREGRDAEPEDAVLLAGGWAAWKLASPTSRQDEKGLTGPFARRHRGGESAGRTGPAGWTTWAVEMAWLEFGISGFNC